MSAVALNSVVWSSTRIGAVALGGLIIAVTNVQTCFFLAGAGFGVMAIVMALLKVPPIPRGSKGNPTQDMWEGLKFIKANSIFSFLISMTFFNSFFGMAYVVMVPVVAKDHLGLGADGLGYLLGASGVGSLLVNIWLGSRRNIGNKGFMIRPPRATAPIRGR